MNQFFLRISDPNSNTGHMVEDTYAIHLSWHICQVFGWEESDVEDVLKSQRQDTEVQVFIMEPCAVVPLVLG